MSSSCPKQRRNREFKSRTLRVPIPSSCSSISDRTTLTSRCHNAGLARQTRFREKRMKRISIGSWAYSIGPYTANPVPFDEVVDRLAQLGFDGVELGGFPPHPNPDDLPERGQRQELTAKVKAKGLDWSGLA